MFAAISVMIFLNFGGEPEGIIDVCCRKRNAFYRVGNTGKMMISAAFSVIVLYKLVGTEGNGYIRCSLRYGVLQVGET